jgi:hypothetical protein
MMSKSRYEYGGKTEASDRFYEWWERRSFELDPGSDFAYMIPDAFDRRPDLVSTAIYGSPEYAWFILQFNKIIDPTEEFTAGTYLLLPTEQRMGQLLSTKFALAKSTREFTPGILRTS